jgi:hypothetical protein
MYSNFLLGYQDILSEASSQLQHLRDETLEFFGHPPYLGLSARDPCRDLDTALASILGIANDLTRNQIAFSSQNELRTALSTQISIKSVLSSLHTPKMYCHLCEKEWEKEWEQQREKEEEEGEKKYEKSGENPWSSNNSIMEDTIKDFKQAGAICQEVLAQQAQISAMIRCAWQDHFAQIEDYSAQVYSRILSIRAIAIFVLGEARHSSISTQRVNRFCLLPDQDENDINRDFLGRTISHQLVDLSDGSTGFIQPEHFLLIGATSSYRVQDRLGRTLLHLLCQKGSYGCVERSLQIGADPSATTIYGHLPLHYAAQRGDFDMCKLLLRYKERFDIWQIDKFSRTAHNYAVFGNHQEVKWLLEDAAEEQFTDSTSGEE